MYGQVIWITGLSGSGKTTIARALCKRLDKLSLKPILLDGDNLREIFSAQDEVTTPYSRENRIKLSHKYGLLCKDLSSQGFTVVIATVSMFAEIYAWNRVNLPKYFEVFLNVPLKELRRRDPKNLYADFFSGDICNVAGLDLIVDQPMEAHLVVDFKEKKSKEKIVDMIIENRHRWSSK